jgi:superfamily I DNA/RNA helicase
VWDLYVAYDAELRAAKVDDFADVVRMAEQELRRKPLDPPYAAVIVDEAQDLTCVMVRMLHALVGDAPDGLTLMGDGQQSIYPGGYTLAEVGINVAGRGVVLDVNYRNTAEILAYASRVVDGDDVVDIDGGTGRGDRPVAVPRRGPAPVHVRCHGWAERDRLLVERVREVTAEVGVGLGDVGVLCQTRQGAQAVTRALRAAGFAVVDLTDYDGAPVDAVKVGTVKRAKGLEFKHVLIADASDDVAPGAPAPAEPAERERWELRRRELYVAMTRARDGLWVAVV